MSERAKQLVQDAAEAADLRAYDTHPDVVALRIERVRRQVDRMCWCGIGLGLAFTMTNVQGFASVGTRVGSLPWLAAWLLDPTVSMVLLAILRAEQITARYQARTGAWVRRAKWVTLVATYVMNTWASYVAGSLSAIVLHSVPPLVVFVAVEAITDLRDKLTDAAVVAGRRSMVHEPVVSGPAPRKFFADYLVEARAAWSPGQAVTPTWVREVTGCSRGLSSQLAKARHRLADGWQGSTVRAILDNPRYTGYAVFGRWTKHEELLNPDDVAAGHVVRFRRASADRVVRSRKPAHPAIVSVEDFTEVQLLRRSKAAGGLPARRKLERGPRLTSRPYVFRGRVRCGICERRMEGAPRKSGTYYRCDARKLVPGSVVLATHPKNVYLPEAVVLDALNGWLGQTFAREDRDATVAALLASQGGPVVDGREAARKRLDAAEAKPRRLSAAIEAGVDPVPLVESINAARRSASQRRPGWRMLPHGIGSTRPRCTP